MAKKNELKSKIEENIQISKKNFQKQLFEKRIDIIKLAANYVKDKKPAKALKELHHYISVLEQAKSVKAGALSPDLFHPKDELIELLTVTAIYWDLACIYDRSKSDQMSNHYEKYLQKFIQFTKKSSYEVLAAEHMRKYILRGKPIHKKAFRDGYRMITGKNPQASCFIASVLSEHYSLSVVEDLRSYRDKVLKNKPWGRRFIFFYYKISPRVSKVLDLLPYPFQSPFAGVIRLIAKWTKE